MMNSESHVSLLQLSCHEASRLASEALDRELTRRERWALRIHMLLCAACRKFASQLRFLRLVVAKLPGSRQTSWSAYPIRLSEQRRDAIKRLLVEAGGTGSQG